MKTLEKKARPIIAQEYKKNKIKLTLKAVLTKNSSLDA